MSKEVISVNNISKKFGNKTILNNLSFNVHEKDSLVILGKSGTGKSVLFKCILGMLTLDTGSVFINHKRANGISEKQRFLINKHISMVFQGSALFDSYTIIDNVTFALAVNNEISNSEKLRIATEALEKVGLESSILNLYPNEISGGMQKRVAFARSIATKPKIIFFDEPTSGLDPVSSTIINNLIKQITKDMGVTSLIITHDIKSAKDIASNILFLDNGEMAWLGAVQDLHNADNKLLNNFINGIPS